MTDPYVCHFCGNIYHHYTPNVSMFFPYMDLSWVITSFRFHADFLFLGLLEYGWPSWDVNRSPWFWRRPHGESSRDASSRDTENGP